jgi:hypothetical protein
MARNKRNKLLLQAHPRCIYCDEAAASETVDHVPGRDMFVKPGFFGWLTPACCACNKATRQTEQAVAHFARLLDPSQRSHDKMTIRRSAVKNNVTGYADEVAKGIDPFAPRTNDMGGAEIQYRCERYGVKMAMAHYWALRKRAFPAAGAIVCQGRSLPQVSHDDRTAWTVMANTEWWSRQGENRRYEPWQSSWAMRSLRGNQFPALETPFYAVAFILMGSLLIEVQVSETGEDFDPALQRIWKSGFRMVAGTEHNYLEFGEPKPSLDAWPEIVQRNRLAHPRFSDPEKLRADC